MVCTDLRGLLGALADRGAKPIGEGSSISEKGPKGSRRSVGELTGCDEQKVSKRVRTVEEKRPERQSAWGDEVSAEKRTVRRHESSDVSSNAPSTLLN